MSQERKSPVAAGLSRDSDQTSPEHNNPPAWTTEDLPDDGEPFDATTLGSLASEPISDADPFAEFAEPEPGQSEQQYDFGPPPPVRRLGMYDKQMAAQSGAHRDSKYRGAKESEAASAPAFRFVAAGDMPIKPIAWLIRKYIEEDTLAVLYGAPGKGKSFLALDVSCCIATGTDFHGHEVKKGAVFYIAGEGHNGIARRVAAWAEHNGVPLAGAPLFVSEGPTDLASATNAARVAEAVQQLADATGFVPELIVIDTLARNFGGDENSATDVGQFVRHVDTHLRHKWKATTLIVHHSGKDGERGARGSSALKGAADAEYEVSRNADDKIIRLTPRKMKDAEEPAPIAFELVGVPLLDNTGNPVGGAALKVTEYSEPPPPAKAGMGKNQEKALATLEQMHKEIADRLASQGRDDHPVHILTEDWRQRCEDSGIPRNRYKEARDALLKRNTIRLEGPHVVLLAEPVRIVRTPLVVSDDSDAFGGGSFGQIGRDSDAIRTEIGNPPADDAGGDR